MDYSNIELIPKRTIVTSRDECDTSVDFLGYKFRLPIIPANMESVISPDLALELTKRGYFYILHRFMPYEDIISFVNRCHRDGVISSISIGVKQKDYDLINYFHNQGIVPDFITVDVAQADAVYVEKIIPVLHKLKSKLIIGNVGSMDGVRNLRYLGADSVKCGIAPGRGCATYNKTGFRTHPLDLSPEMSNIPLIADGGVRENADIAKALVWGYDMVMIGSMLANFQESPGRRTEINGVTFREYAGSTANNNYHVEGRTVQLVEDGSIWDKLLEIEHDLQSAISYAGGKDLSALLHVEYRVI